MGTRLRGCPDGTPLLHRLKVCQQPPRGFHILRILDLLVKEWRGWLFSEEQPPPPSPSPYNPRGPIITNLSINETVWGTKNTERLILLSEQGISTIYLVFFNLPDNLTVAHDPSGQLCYGRRRQSHASDGRHRCQHPSTFALTRLRECQRHHEGSTPPCRRSWTCRRASAPNGPHSSQRSRTGRFMGRAG